MRLSLCVAAGLLGVFALAAVGCAGSSPAQPPGDLPAAVAGRAGGVGGSATTLARGAHRLGGVRRAIAGCSGIGTGSFVGGTDGNVAAAFDSGVLSGQSNNACDASSGIAVGDSNIINSSGADDEFIGGGTNNAISGGFDTFIGAGNSNQISQSAADAFVGAGELDSMSGSHSFIGAGYSNQVVSAVDAAIAGGESNTVSSSATWGFIGAGYLNKVSGQNSAVLGGSSNTASGTESTVAGGGDNTASGYASFAAGYHADANQAGSFVWSDASSSAATKATAANQFVARSSGGVKFFSNSAMTTGVSLAAGGGSWASVSDRAVKTGVESLDDARVLDKVASLPISEWSYISEHGVRHVGPMAQDFYAAFNIGEDNKHITSIDEDGVALAAIKALNARLASTKAQLTDTNVQLSHTNARLSLKDAALRSLHRQMNDFKQQFKELRKEVAALHARG